METVRVVRGIAADPTSTALLLAGPTGMDFWPGLRRLGDDPDGRVRASLPPSVDAPARDARLVVSLHATAPRRTPTRFVTTYRADGADLPPLSGTVSLGYTDGPDGTLATAAEVVLRIDGPPEGTPAALAERLTRDAEMFLANLARAAELRVSAA